MLYVYVGCLTFGALYAIVSAVLGAHGFDHGGADHGGAHVHGSSDSGDIPSPFNPLVIASAIAAFGAMGVISKLGFGLGDMPSLVFALVFAGIVGAGIFFGVVKLMYGSQSNSTFSVYDIVGEEAEVITPIPEYGLGEVALTVNGVRHSFSAKSSENKTIGRGETVIIREMAGNAAVVTQKMTIDDFESIDIDRRQFENENN